MVCGFTGLYFPNLSRGRFAIKCHRRFHVGGLVEDCCSLPHPFGPKIVRPGELVAFTRNSVWHVESMIVVGARAWLPSARRSERGPANPISQPGWRLATTGARLCSSAGRARRKWPAKWVLRKQPQTRASKARRRRCIRAKPTTRRTGLHRTKRAPPHNTSGCGPPGMGRPRPIAAADRKVLVCRGRLRRM